MRRNILKKIIVALLVGTTVIGMSACKKKPQSEQPSTTVTANKLKYEGTHILTAEDTDKWIVSNGVTSYKLVVPEKLSEQLEIARNEFLYLFEKATGIKLSVITDKDLQHNQDNKYISIGETSLLKSTDIQREYSLLGRDGVRIVTKDNTIYLTGATDYGSLYAVYTFMEMMFDYDCYYKDCITINQNVDNVRLKNFDVTDVPDIAKRCNSYGIYYDGVDYDTSNFLYRMRTPYSYAKEFLPVFKRNVTEEELVDEAKLATYITNQSGKRVHNSFSVLPPETYSTDNWQWYSGTRDQLCYTAHGDEQALDLMVKEAAKKVENTLIVCKDRNAYPQTAITITIEDTLTSCTCDACKELLNKYGTASASVIRWMNLVNKEVRDWMAKEENAEYRRDDLDILLFAYNAYGPAPAVYDENAGKYAPIDDSVVCDDGVSVFYAPILTYDYQQNIYKEDNQTGKNITEAWCALTDKLYLWYYGTNFGCYMVMYDSFSFYDNDGYNYIASNKAEMLSVQGMGGRKGTSTGFANLKVYLNSKLAWNVNEDIDALIDKYMSAMYLDAAPIMKNLYLAERLEVLRVNSENKLLKTGTVYNSVVKANYWRIGALKEWLSLCDVAIGAVEKYKAIDEDLYNRTKYHIEAEWLSPAYLSIVLFPDYFQGFEFTALKKRFKESVTYFGIENISERQKSEDFLASL